MTYTISVLRKMASMYLVNVCYSHQFAKIAQFSRVITKAQCYNVGRLSVFVSMQNIWVNAGKVENTAFSQCILPSYTHRPCAVHHPRFRFLRQISRKWCKIRCWTQCLSDTKPHMGFRLERHIMTLDDLESPRTRSQNYGQMQVPQNVRISCLKIPHRYIANYGWQFVQNKMW